MAEYTPTGPFVSGSGPGIDAPFLNTMETFLEKLDSDSTLADSGTVDLDLSRNAHLTQGPLSGDVTFTGSGYAQGRGVVVRVENGTTLRSLSFPSAWVFVGVKPTEIEASKTGVLAVTSFGTNEAMVVAAWAVQE